MKQYNMPIERVSQRNIKLQVLASEHLSGLFLFFHRRRRRAQADFSHQLDFLAIAHHLDRHLVAPIKPTDKVAIQVMRNCKEINLMAEIGLRPPPAPGKEEE